MPPDRATVRRAVGLSLFSALLWAIYYPLVLLATDGARPSAVLTYPFLFGGVAYLAYSASLGQSGTFVRLFAQPAAWLRTGLLVGMQLSVLGGTYLIGPVDASLLSLIGDVVLTPLVVAVIWSARRGNIGTPLFGVGLVLSVVGGGLTIAGGQGLSAVRGFGWLIVPAIPVMVAFYFLLCAKENERSGAVPVVGQSMLAAGIVCALLSPAVPGGAAGLLHFSLLSILLLLATGIESFFLADVLYFRAIETVGIVIPQMLMTGIPVFTLLLSAIVLGLGLPLVAALGIPIAVAGALLTLRAESTPRPLPDPTRPEPGRD